MRRKLTVMAGVLALALSASVAQADAHGYRGSWHHGFFARNAIVTGTVTAVNGSSFTANAYVLTPGAGGSHTTPATTPVTITEGTGTKVQVFGQSALTVGDTFYATYTGVAKTTPISTLVAGTPSKILAFVAPTPEVEVSGVITAAPTAGSDQFTATATVVQPTFGGSPWTPPPVHGPVPVLGGGSYRPADGFGDSYSYGGQVGGHYGFAGTRSRLAKAHRSGTTTGTPGTTILTDGTTTFDVNGDTSATVSELTVGQKFTAIFDGTPGETLAQIVANPAISVVARSPRALYAFTVTVTATDTTSSPETVSVAVSQSRPSGLFTGTDKFDIGPGTFVFGGSSSSLSSVSVGDVVAGGLVSTGGQAASAIEADPLQVLVDFTAPSGNTTTDASSAKPGIRHLRSNDLKKALKLLDKDQKKTGKKPPKQHQH